MKGFDKEKNKTPNPCWVKLRFYVLILVLTVAMLLLLISINHGKFILENTIPALISLLNAILAYIITKREQGKRSYKDMMDHIKNWTIIRFIVMASLLVLAIVSKIIDPLPFIFSFIGFYILHQVLEIVILQKEATK